MKIIAILLIFNFGNLIAYSQIDFNNLQNEEILINIPIKDSIGIDFKTNKLNIDETSWKKLGLDKLEIYNSNFSFAFTGLVIINDIKLFFIERAYNEENIHWILVVNNENQIIDFLMTAYENSEGFLSIRSEIESDKIIIKEFNEYAEINPNETIYLIGKD